MPASTPPQKEGERVELTGESALTLKEARALRREATDASTSAHVELDETAESLWAGIGRKLDVAMSRVDPGQLIADRLGAVALSQHTTSESGAP